MSLQIWMPFNGNLKNYGLHSSNINTNGTSYCNGKVTSKAYNFIANKTYIKINNTTTFLNQSSKISIAFWAKLDSVSNDAKKYHTLFCCRSSVGNGVSVFYNPVDSLKGFRFDTGHDHQHIFPYEIQNPEEWNHYCFTFNGKKKTVYVNGDSIGSQDCETILDDIGEYILIGTEEISNPSHNIVNGSLNDYRIYDHCLSAGEIKELAQGLILHYPLSDNTYDKILDCSGYGHDGVRMGTGFINDNDAPRHYNSLHFSGSDSILATHALSPTKATIATWIKFDNALENSIIAFADNKSKIAFGYYSNANYFILSCSEQRSTVVTQLTETLAPNNWYHIAVVRDGNNFTLYVNGNPQEHLGGEDYWTHNLNEALILGGRSRDGIVEYQFAGSLSDFRMYATALSPEIIMRLYNAPISVMKNAHLIANEFIEKENKETSFNKTGVVSGDSFATMTSTHHMPIQQLNDGSMWARIHYLDLTRKNEYFDNSIAAADKTTDKYNRYSYLKEIDKFVYNPLPYRYELLNYIEAKGDAYIETDVLMSDNITRLEASYIKTDMDDTQILFGACAPGDVDYCYFDYLEACYQYGTLWGKTGLRFSDVTYSPGNHINSSITMNGMEFTYQINEHHISGVMSKKPTENYTYYLFADHSSSGAAIYHTSCYLYGFKIWIDNKLARNYIPCKNPSGVIGLYETILGKFYTHPSLVAGDTVSNTPYEFMLTYHDSLANIPKNYTRLQYITSDGTQYINTRYIPNNNTRLLMTYQQTGTFPSNDVAAIFGARKAGEDSVFGCWIDTTKAYPHYGHRVYDTNTINSFTPSDQNVFDYYNGQMTINESAKNNKETVTFDSQYPLTLLAMNTAGKIDTRRAAGKLYGCQIYENGALIRYFTPCRNASGQIGLYEAVTETFYLQAAGNAFSAGPTLNTWGYDRWVQTSSPKKNSVENFHMISRSPHFEYNNNGLMRRTESATQDCYYCCDFASGNWYAALGQHRPWLPQGKTPGIPTSMNNATPEQITELWVRIDNLPNNSQCQIFKNAIQATDFIEH